MDPAAAWTEIERFQEQRLVTTASLHGGPQEKLLVQQFLQRVPLEALFLALQQASDAGETKKVKIACAVLDRVLGSDANDGMFYKPEMLPFILAGLNHHEKAARVLTANQLINHLKNEPTEEQAKALVNAPLVGALCHAIADDQVEVAAKAVTVLDTMASIDDQESYKPVLDALYSAVSNGDVSDSSVEFMRYLEAIARISRKSDQHMQHAIAFGAIDIILNCLTSSDTLFVMNVLDLIPNLIETSAGIVHIFESGTLQTLLKMSQDPLIGDSALRLIGETSASAAKLKIQSWSWSDPMLSKAFLATIEAKIESEELQQIAAMDAIAAFGSSSEKELHLLLQHKHLCKLMLQLGASTKMPLKVNCLHAVARILAAPTRLHKAADQIPAENATIWELHERLFNSLGVECRHPTTMALLMVCLRQPFEEIRVAVYTLLQAVASQNNEWGMRTLLSYGGFFEYLMDRSTEPTKSTREWKFAVVDAVLASRFVGKLDGDIQQKLKDHMRDGPYVGKGLTEMAMEAA